MECDHVTLSKSFVTGEVGVIPCSEINKVGNCLGFEPNEKSAQTEVISEVGGKNE